MKIQSRERPAGMTEMHFAAVTELNVMRFLCGVSSDVELSETLNDQAQEAAEACQEKNLISHELGHFTEVCSIAMGNNSIADTIRQYVDDAGEVNRDARGHRLACFQPEMKTTGFGMVAGRWSTMHVRGLGGSRAQEPYAYPGMGFFPIDRVYGNAWSFYLPEPAPSALELKVEVHRLPKRPIAEVPLDYALPGESLEIHHVSTFRNAVNFEPFETEAEVRAGVYFVRITGGGVAEQYVVELF